MTQVGFVYKLCCIDPEIKEIYVGSTKNLRVRKGQHKFNSNNESSNKYNCNVYQFIRSNGGFENWNIIQLERFEFNTKYELHARERHYIELLKANLNKHVPTRTYTEYYDDNKEKVKDRNKEYYDANKENIKKSTKKWYEENKEKMKENYKRWSAENKIELKEYYKEYYNENREILKEKNKEYNEKHKEKLKEYKKKYREENKEKIKEYNKKKYEENKIKNNQNNSS